MPGETQEQPTKRPVVLNEKGEVIDDPGYREERHPTEEEIKTVGKVVANRLSPEQQDQFLKLGHELGLEERRQKSIKAGEQGRNWQYAPEAPVHQKSLWDKFKELFGG